MLPRSPLARKTKALTGTVQQHGLLTLKIVASVLYNLFHTTYHEKLFCSLHVTNCTIFAQACIEDISTEVVYALCFIFVFQQF